MITFRIEARRFPKNGWQARASLVSLWGAYMSGNDTEYFRRRAVAERTLAATASNAAAAEIHNQLAERYEALTNGSGRRPTLRIATPEATH